MEKFTAEQKAAAAAQALERLKAQHGLEMEQEIYRRVLETFGRLEAERSRVLRDAMLSFLLFKRKDRREMADEAKRDAEAA